MVKTKVAHHVFYTRAPTILGFPYMIKITQNLDFPYMIKIRFIQKIAQLLENDRAQLLAFLLCRGTPWSPSYEHFCLTNVQNVQKCS